MNKSAPKQLPALQWDILSRSSKPLDWAWVGGVVLVSVVVGMLLGAKYIGLALILYVFVFCMAFRGWIRVNYPAEEGMRYYIGGEFSSLSDADKSQVRLKKKAYRRMLVLLGILSILPYVIYLLVPELVLEYMAEASTLVTLMLCVGSVLLRYRALFVSCFGGGKLATTSDQQLQRTLGKRRHDGGFSGLRLSIVTMLWLLVWAGMVYAYATGQLGGTRVFGLDLSMDYARSRTLDVIIYFPGLVHLLSLGALLSILRGWGEYYNG